MTQSITSTSTQMNLQDISKDYVVEQLKVLGFDEVPEYLVDEFLQELKSGNSTMLDQKVKDMGGKRRESNSSMSSRLDTSMATSFKTHTSFVDDADESDDDENEEDEDDVSITAYTTFTQPSRLDSSDILSRRDHELQHATVVDESLRDIPTHSLMIKSKKRQMPVDYTKDFDKENKQHMVKMTKQVYQPPQRVKRPLSARSRPAKQVSSALASSHAQQQQPWGRSTTRQQRPMSARSSTRPMSARRRPSTASYRPSRPRQTGTRCRKHDPVARYAQMQKTWKKTGFLNKMKSGRKPLRLQVRREMREISQNSEKYGYRHIY